MTGAQSTYLQTLCEEADEAFNPNLTKSRIDELRHKTGRADMLDVNLGRLGSTTSPSGLFFQSHTDFNPI